MNTLTSTLAITVASVQTPPHEGDFDQMVGIGLVELIEFEPGQGREQLLRFLQISVATWARPDAAHDVSVDSIRGQWDPAAETLNLNPRNRTQTRKYRPIVPVPRQLVGLLNEADGFYVKVGSVRKAFEEMQRNLSLPGERQAGLKLIRRSIAQLARKRLGEADWIEGRQMLGHHRPTVSDNYAPSDPSYLSRARAVTEEIIAEIIALAPLAFASSGKENRENPKA